LNPDFGPVVVFLDCRFIVAIARLAKFDGRMTADQSGKVWIIQQFVLPMRQRKYQKLTHTVR
jgi:hypothetical protein